MSKMMNLKYMVALSGLVLGSTATAVPVTCAAMGGSLSGSVCTVPLNAVYGISANDLTNDNDNDIIIGRTSDTATVTTFTLTNNNQPIPLVPAPLVLDIQNTDELVMDASALPGSNLDLQGGNDLLTNIVSGVTTKVTVNGNLLTGSGDDTAILDEVVFNGNTQSGDGNDTLTFSNSSVTGEILSEADDDSLTMLDTTVVGNSNGGTGNDSFVCDGSTATNGSFITGNILAGDGADVFHIYDSSTVVGDIDAGAGDDVEFDFNNDSAITGTIIGGAGSDIIHLNDNAKVDDVFMDDDNAAIGVPGNATIGQGNDHLWLNGANIQVAGTVRLDGGDDYSTPSDNLTDILHLNGWSGTAPQLTNWELIELTNGANVYVAQNTDAGAWSTAVGTTLRADGTTVMTGDVTNEGTLILLDTATSGGVTNNGDIIAEDGNTDDNPVNNGDVSGGNVHLDVNPANHGSDILTITGDNTGTLVIFLNNIDTTNSSDSQNIPLVVVNGNSGSATLEGGAMTYVAGGVTYDLLLLGDTWTLVPRLAPTPAQPVPAISNFGLFSMLLVMLLGAFAFTHRKQ